MPMPLRQNSPMQRGYGPRMMHQRYYGGMPNQNFYYPPQMGAPQMGAPMMGRNQGNRGGGGGGLLAKILGRGKQQGGYQGAIPSMERAAAGGGGILKSLANPDALNGFLNNTQTVLKTAQQFGPIIQQYGPLVRNLPSLWKLYRGLKDATSENSDSETIPSNSDTEDDDQFVEISTSEQENTSNQPLTNSNPKTSEKNQSSLMRDKRSVPKLYI